MMRGGVREIAGLLGGTGMSPRAGPWQTRMSAPPNTESLTPAGPREAGMSAPLEREYPALQCPWETRINLLQDRHKCLFLEGGRWGRSCPDDYIRTMADKNVSHTEMQRRGV